MFETAVGYIQLEAATSSICEIVTSREKNDSFIPVVLVLYLKLLKYWSGQ
jgi:hypothetical protein